MIGDPCGVGPEVVVKALAGMPAARVLMIGDTAVLRSAAKQVGVQQDFRTVTAIEEAQFVPGCVDVLDPGTLRAGDVTPGRLSAACGRAVDGWRAMAFELARQGRIDAIVQAPINAEAIRLGTGSAPVTAGSGQTHILLVAEKLRVVHLTDHVTLAQMLASVKKDNLLELLRVTDRALTNWGLPAPSIAVAGLNPHCAGPEDRDEIRPAVLAAAGEGIQAVGPISPDSVFRQCANGAFDCVVAHYHDQGHIAVKTASFSGNIAIVVGEPCLRLSVGHGTAFDIAGQGIADPLSMQSALRNACSLAAGAGFS